MPFVFLLLFALIFLQSSWPGPLFEWPTPAGCAILVGTIVITSWLSAWLIARVLAWQLARPPERRSALLRRYARWRRYHFVTLLAAYLVALYVLGWGSSLLTFWREYVPAFLHSADNLPGFQIVLLAPFFVSLIAAWERFYIVEKTAYELTHDSERFVPKLPYLLMQLRHQFFLVLPPIMLMFALQSLYVLFGDLEQRITVPAVVGDLGLTKEDAAASIMIAIMGGALVAMPLLLRIFLGLKPLRPGPLRDRLEATAHRLGFRYSNILVWNTRHMMANALVTGFVPWIRYVILTDKLIDELAPEEIEAVFGHEVGHIKHHHLFFYLVFFLTSFILLSIFWSQFRGLIDIGAITAALPWSFDPKDVEETFHMLGSFGKLGLLAVYTFLCFGFVSRRCERQADLFGSHTVSTDVFISALEKVAALNGIPRDRAGNWLLSWQHPTIAQRVDFLEAMRDDPARIPGFQRGIFMLKASFFLALLFLVSWFGVAEVWNMLFKDF
jgi:Zn-dependent protease with chaperone function